MKLTKVLCVSLLLCSLFGSKAIAKETYSDYANNWAICSEYPNTDKLEDHELIVSSKNARYRYAVLKYCVSVVDKQILVIASIYVNDGRFLTVGSFDFKPNKSILKLYKVDDNAEVLELPDSAYKSDYSAVFYDGKVTQDELDTFIIRVFRKL